MDLKKISVIIPLHNGSLWIAETIRSVLNQTWKNLEVIVVENGSSDNSLEIAQEFLSDVVKVYSIPQTTASAARNYGMEMAIGDYFQFLDADDILSNDKIEKQMHLMDKFGEDYLISCGWGKFKNDIIEAEFIPQEVWDDFSPVDWLISSWSGGGMMQTACWLTSRKLIEKSGKWNEELIDNPNDDGEFFARVISNSKGIRFCPEARVYYRTAINNSLSRKISDQAVQSLFATCEIYENLIRSVEDSCRTRKAATLNYLNFIYRFHPSHKELLNKAFLRVNELGVKPLPVVGGVNFVLLVKIVGFRKALKMRSFIQN